MELTRLISLKLLKEIFVLKNILFLQELLLGDSTKAREALGWKPKYDFDVSIKFVLD